MSYSRQNKMRRANAPRSYWLCHPDARGRLALWVSQQRTAHMKKYLIAQETWYVFIWLCMLDSARHAHHHDTWKETRAGRDRAAQRRFKHDTREISLPCVASEL